MLHACVDQQYSLAHLTFASSTAAAVVEQTHSTLMQLRKRTTPPAGQKARRSSQRPSPQQCSDLPPELLCLFGDRLSIEDLANASSVCKLWAQHLRGGITRATVIVSNRCLYNDDDRMPPLTSLSIHSPALCELQLLLSGRSSYAAVQAVMSGLHVLGSLQKLRLSFLVSQTPKKGLWPMFFSDDLNMGKVASLTVEGSCMPPIAITNLLDTLAGTKHVKSLQLLMGQPLPGSQLPSYNPPIWLQQVNYLSAFTSALSTDQIDRLAKLTSLEELSFAADAAVGQASFRQLQKLKALTSLQLNGSVSEAAFVKLALLKKLRKLSVTVRVTGLAGNLDWSDFRHVRDLSLGLAGSAGPAESPHYLHSELQGLTSSLTCNLRGLCISGFIWANNTVNLLAGLTALTSLELLQVKAGADGGSALDLSALGKLRSIQKFTMHFPSVSMLQVKFTVDGQQEKQGSSSQQSSGRRSRKQQKEATTTSSKDLSGLLKAWPTLQTLHLKNLTPSAVSDTAWDFRPLTSLTSLALQFTPSADAIVAAIADPHVPCHLDTIAAKLRLDQMPQQLQELQLTGCVLMVPFYSPFGDSLIRLSMSHCWLQRSWDLQLRDSAIGGGSSSSSSDQPRPQHQPLVVLLQHLPALQQLELADMHHTQLNDGLLAAAASGPSGLAAAAAAASGPSGLPGPSGLTSSLRGLTSLSILGIGNQGLSHGGLLGLTELKKLRQLRWHVGDALELMPDMAALAQLKGLVALHIPTWLHAHMERWGAYAVLDSLPFCDVHVEAT